MKSVDKEIYEKLHDLVRVSHSEKKFQETQALSIRSLYREEAKTIISPFEFIYLQSKYIKKRWWTGQLLLLLLVWFFICMAVQESDIKRGLGVAASMFAMLILPEIMKNAETNSMEIEGTVYYSLRRIYGVRILIFAFVDLILLSGFGAVCVLSGGVLIPDYLIQFILPYVVSCGICFTCLYDSRVKSIFMAVFLCMIWCVIWVQIVLNERLYQTVSIPVWIGLLLLAGIYLVFCIYRGQKNINESWEVRTEWN